MSTKSSLRVAELDEYRNAAWAIEPGSLPLIAAFGRRVVADVDDLQAALGAEQPPSRSGGRGVAVMSLSGVIMPGPSLLGRLLGIGGGLQEFRANLRAAVADESVGGIVLDIDSPGGSTDQVTETAAEIRAARQIKPVVAVANSKAASAAYWLAAQADELVVTPSGQVGSIGVYGVHQDLTGALANEGITATLISAGKYKTEGNPLEPLTDEAREAFQALVNDVYGMFVADVAKGRGVTAASVRDGFGQGRMVTAKSAVTDGMADRVDTLDNVIARMARRPGGTPRRSTSANELQPLIEAAETEPDNPNPNDTPQVSEEGRARINALLAEHPIHTQETAS